MNDFRLQSRFLSHTTPIFASMIHGILFHLLLAIALGAMAWAFPAKPIDTESSIDEPTLKRLYAKAIWYIMLGLFFWMPLMVWGLGTAIHLLVNWNQAAFSDTPDRIDAPLPAWICVAFFFAMAWMRKPMEETVRYFLGQEALDAANIMSSRIYGYSIEASWQWISKFCTIIGIIAMVFISDYGVYVYDKQLVFNDLLTLFQKRTVPIEAIAAIEFERNLQTEKAPLPSDPVYAMHFKDGSIWRSNFYDFQNVDQVMQTIVRQSGMKVDTVFVTK